MENKPASSLVVLLGKALNETPLSFMWKTGGPDALNGPQKAMANHCGILPRKLHEHSSCQEIIRKHKIHEYSS